MSATNGATKSIIVDGSSQSNNEVRIIGFNHDTVDSDWVSYYKATTAGITFEFVNIPEKRVFNAKKTIDGGWKASDMRFYLNNDFKNSLNPNGISGQFICVEKKTNNKGLDASVSDVTVTSDYIWLLSGKEVCGNGGMLWDEDHESVYNAEGSQYEYYINKGARPQSCKAAVKSGAEHDWWLRTPYCYDGTSRREFCDILETGVWGSNAVGESDYDRGVSPCFCL